jgi:hypothetical protein
MAGVEPQKDNPPGKVKPLPLLGHLGKILGDTAFNDAGRIVLVIPEEADLELAIIIIFLFEVVDVYHFEPEIRRKTVLFVLEVSSH